MKFIGTTLFVSAAYLAALVSAQKAPVSITSPLMGTKYKAGQEAIIAWINPSVQTIPEIILAKGPSTALQPVLTIAKDVNANDLKYVWKIPLEIESSNEYAFELGKSPDIAFAGPFTIEGGTGGASPSSNATSPSNGSSSSPAAPAGAAPAGAAPAGGNTGATPAAPSASPSGSSQTSARSPAASHASAANKQMVGQAAIAFGMAAAVASQFF